MFGQVHFKRTFFFMLLVLLLLCYAFGFFLMLGSPPMNDKQSRDTGLPHMRLRPAFGAPLPHPPRPVRNPKRLSPGIIEAKSQDDIDRDRNEGINEVEGRLTKRKHKLKKKRIHGNDQPPPDRMWIGDVKKHLRVLDPEKGLQEHDFLMAKQKDKLKKKMNKLRRKKNTARRKRIGRMEEVYDSAWQERRELRLNMHNRKRRFAELGQLKEKTLEQIPKLTSEFAFVIKNNYQDDELDLKNLYSFFLEIKTKTSIFSRLHLLKKNSLTSKVKIGKLLEDLFQEQPQRGQAALSQIRYYHPNPEHGFTNDTKLKVPNNKTDHTKLYNFSQVDNILTDRKTHQTVRPDTSSREKRTELRFQATMSGSLEEEETPAHSQSSGSSSYPHRTEVEILETEEPDNFAREEPHETAKKLSLPRSDNPHKPEVETLETEVPDNFAREGSPETATALSFPRKDNPNRTEVKTQIETEEPHNFAREGPPETVKTLYFPRSDNPNRTEGKVLGAEIPQNPREESFVEWLPFPSREITNIKSLKTEVPHKMTKKKRAKQMPFLSRENSNIETLGTEGPRKIGKENLAKYRPLPGREKSNIESLGAEMAHHKLHKREVEESLLAPFLPLHQRQALVKALQSGEVFSEQRSVGGDVELACHNDAMTAFREIPGLKIHWMLNSEAFSFKPSRMLFDGDEKLIMKDLRVSDTGVYECRAEFTADKSSVPLAFFALSVTSELPTLFPRDSEPMHLDCHSQDLTSTLHSLEFTLATDPKFNCREPCQSTTDVTKSTETRWFHNGTQPSLTETDMVRKNFPGILTQTSARQLSGEWWCQVTHVPTTRTWNTSWYRVFVKDPPSDLELWWRSAISRPWLISLVGFISLSMCIVMSILIARSAQKEDENLETRWQVMKARMHRRASHEGGGGVKSSPSISPSAANRGLSFVAEEHEEELGPSASEASMSLTDPEDYVPRDSFDINTASSISKIRMSYM